MATFLERASLLGGVAILAAALAVSSPGRVDAVTPTDVRVVNAPAEPVPVRTRVQPCRMQKQVTVLGGYPTSATDIFLVPVTKRLTIEHVTVETAGTTSANRFAFRVMVWPRSIVPTRFTLVPTAIGPDDLGFTRYVAGGPMRLHVDPGAAIYIEVERHGAVGIRGPDDLRATFAIAGYLEDAL